MKTLILILIIAILLIASIIWGVIKESHAEFLRCDPSSDPIIGGQVEVTKGEVITVYPLIYVLDGADVRVLDLTGFSNGSYIFKARWWTDSLWPSDWSDAWPASKAGKPPGVWRIK